MGMTAVLAPTKMKSATTSLVALVTVSVSAAEAAATAKSLTKPLNAAAVVVSVPVNVRHAAVNRKLLPVALTCTVCAPDGMLVARPYMWAALLPDETDPRLVIATPP